MTAKKSVAEYEAEAVRVGDCLIHKREWLARKLYQKRHSVMLPPDVLVCHSCDTPLCIEDRHHFLGSHRDNQQDAVAKGRHSLHNPDTKARIHAAGRAGVIASWSDPESRAKRVEDNRVRWRDPEFRAKQLAGLERHFQQKREGKK